MKRSTTVALVLICASAASAQNFSDGFDSYTAGSNIAGQGGWAVWCDGGVDASVSNAQAHSAPNSLRVAPGSDIVHTFSNASSGQWTFKVWTYMPSNAGGVAPRSGWVNLMNAYCVGGPPPPAPFHSWSTATKFSVDEGLVTAWTGTGTLPIILDQWVEYRVEIDLDADRFSEFYNNQQLTSNLVWTTNVGGGTTDITAVDLYSDVVDGMFFDDVSLTEVGGVCYADCTLVNNQTGQGLNVADFICFQTQYSVGNTAYADCTFVQQGIGQGLNVADFICYQTQYSLGCP